MQNAAVRAWVGVLFLIFSGFTLQVLATASWRNPDTLTQPHIDPFPRPPGLDNAVRFWRQVFGVWRRNQVALHDNEHLGVVYEIIDLPGTVDDSLTPEQRAYVSERQRVLETALRELQSRVQYGLALSNAQQRLLNTITDGAGRSALYGASARVRSQRGMRELFQRGLEISGRYDRLFRQIFREAGLPEDLAYLPHLESSFNPQARSSAGAVGMWQFMPATGRRFLRINQAVDERYDPVLAARGAARYLADSYARLGDWALALTSYNHGIGGILRAKQQFGTDIERIARHYRGPAFGFASRNFYAEFLAVRDIIANLREYFPNGIRFDPPFNHERIRLRYPTTTARLAELFGVDHQTLAHLNPAWTPSAIRGHYTLPADTEVWLPRGITAQVALARLQSQPATLAAAQPPRSPRAKAGVPKHNTRKNTINALAAKDKKTLNWAPPSRLASKGGASVRTVAYKTGTKPSKLKSSESKSKERLHVVRRGESLHSIAANYGIQLTKLLTLNDITRRSTIHPGQRLRIPIRY